VAAPSPARAAAAASSTSKYGRGASSAPSAPRTSARRAVSSRVAGKRASGSWDTQKWLISKEHAHRVGGRLVPDTADARKLLKVLGAPPRHVAGDRFKAKDRPNVPERKKPTPAMRRARTRNIRKARAARGRRR
jgi:hypothetical protein